MNREDAEIAERRAMRIKNENAEKIESLKSELLDKANHVADKIQFYKDYSSRAERLDYSEYNKNVSIVLLNVIQAYKELEGMEKNNES